MQTLAAETLDRLTTIEHNYTTGKRTSDQHYQDLRRLADDLYYSRAYKHDEQVAKIYVLLTNAIKEA